MPKTVQLLVNDEVRNHEQELGKLLLGSRRMECMVAFAKTSGFLFFQKNLEMALAAGLEARFAIGLSFFLTEPKLLRALLKLDGKNKFSLYISNTSATFHPKIYALSDGNRCTVVIGSANLTQGGLQDNYEASALIDDPEGQLMASVSSHIDELIAERVLVRATSASINKYERLYTTHKAQQLLAMRRADRLGRQKGMQTETLSEILTEMKIDDSKDGFDFHQNFRRNNRKAAAKKIRWFGNIKKLEEKSFLVHYEQLIQLFHSGGLHRSKNKIAKHRQKFLLAISAIVKSSKLPPSDAYQLLLEHFLHIPGAGVNVITELLHAIDCKRFAVMNQNAVSGLSLANIHEFPLKPAKSNVSAERYAHFCQQATIVRKDLGLADFTELDALFNYAYWGHEEDEEVAVG